MSLIDSKGVNDLQHVADFTQAAASLGIGQNNGRLHSVIAAAEQTGALAAGHMDMGAVENAVTVLKSGNLLPPNFTQTGQMVNLLQAAKNMGMTAANFSEKISTVNQLAQKVGMPSSRESGEQAPKAGTPSDGKAVNWHQLHCKEFDFKDILQLELSQAMNQHARLHVGGTLPEAQDNSKSYVQAVRRNTPITIQYTDGHGNVTTFFKGMVINIKEKMQGGLKYLDIDAVSHSYQLDIQKHSRSYQRSQAPYSYIFERINEMARQYVPNLSGNAVMAPGGEDKETTGRLIVQYEESEWAFLKRLASHFNQGLTVDIRFDSPKIYFGMPPENTRSQQLKATEYHICRDIENYERSSENRRKNSGAAVSENDFTFCEVQSPDILKLGQKVSFLQRDFYVLKMHTSMDKSALNNHYILTTRRGLMQDDLYNDSLAGRSLHGVVKKIANDQVKVHITDIDPKWDDKGQWYFPYTTVYSSPDGSGLYIMPEVNDAVRVYFPNSKEEQAVAASSVNLTPSKRGARTDPNTKIISTVHGKQIIITPQGIQILANDNLLMTLSDEGGLTVKSNKKIRLEAQDDIEITSKTSKIIVNGKNEINLTQSGGNLQMVNNNIQFNGNQVKLQP
jgi:hypothetical protein